MGNRTELKADKLEQVAGGCFTYVDTDGKNGADKCTVDGYGDFHCNADSKNNIRKLMYGNPGISYDDLVALAISNGYIWKDKAN